MIRKKIALMMAIAISAHGITSTLQITQDLEPRTALSARVQSGKFPDITLNRVQEQAIQAHMAALKSQRYYKNIARTAAHGLIIGAKGLAAMAMLSMLSGYIKPWIRSSTVVLQPAPSELPANFVPRFLALENAVSPATFSWQWFKNNGAYIASSVAVMGVASLGATTVNEVNKAIFHPDSLEWFIQNKTNLTDLLPFQIDPKHLINGFQAELQMQMMMLKNQDRLKKSTIDELRDYVGALETLESMSEENKAMSAYLIKSTCNSMVAALELILGFMALKHEHACGSIALEIESHMGYIRSCTNLFCDKLEGLLADTAIDGQKKKQDALSALNSFKGDLTRVLRRFVVIEREQNI